MRSSYLQYVIESQVAVTLAGDVQGAGGLLHFVRLVSGCLSVLHLSDLQVFSHFIKVLLCLFEFAHIPTTSTTETKILKSNTHNAVLLIKQ